MRPRLVVKHVVDNRVLSADEPKDTSVRGAKVGPARPLGRQKGSTVASLQDVFSTRWLLQDGFSTRCLGYLGCLGCLGCLNCGFSTRCLLYKIASLQDVFSTRWLLYKMASTRWLLNKMSRLFRLSELFKLFELWLLYKISSLQDVFSTRWLLFKMSRLGEFGVWASKISLRPSIAHFTVN